MRAIFVALLLVSGPVFAETFYWYATTLPGQKFADPVSLCLILQPKDNDTTTFEFNKFNLQSASYGLCQYKRTVINPPPQPPSVYLEHLASIYRGGGECPVGASYDEVKMACDCGPDKTLDLGSNSCVAKPPEPEPDKCEAGQTDLFASAPSPVVQISGRNQVLSNPPTGCKNGCAYTASSSKTRSCYFVPGSQTDGFCNYLLTSDGNSCAADSGNPGAVGPPLNPTPPTDPDEPPSDPKDPGCPTGYSWSGTTCVKSDGSGGPGGDGGTGGGGDGGGDGGTGGGGDGGGDGGTGGGGDGGGTPGTGGDGGGTGGGTGGGDGSGEGGGTGGGTGLEGGCKDDSCAFVKNNPFGEDKVPGFDESLQKAWTDIKKAPIGQALERITFPSGGSCPTQSVELFGKGIMFDSHCDLWGQIEPILKAVFLAFWALLSVRVFLSA